MSIKSLLCAEQLWGQVKWPVCLQAGCSASVHIIPWNIVILVTHMSTKTSVQWISQLDWGYPSICCYINTTSYKVNSTLPCV